MTDRRRNWELPTREFARRETFARCERVLAEIDRISRNAGEDEVHDLRVSIRRFTQAVRIFEPLLPKRTKKIVKRVRMLLAAAGEVRDLDVGIERLLKLGVPEQDPLLLSMHETRRRLSLQLLGEVFKLRAGAPEQSWPAVFLPETAPEVAQP
ncbi:MAG: CHAD domain-containing protein [Bryobacteraceae bacterium]|nr:CHAD domain-containing protein [Bryobacteraceae bacterium]